MPTKLELSEENNIKKKTPYHTAHAVAFAFATLLFLLLLLNRRTRWGKGCVKFSYFKSNAINFHCQAMQKHYSLTKIGNFVNTLKMFAYMWLGNTLTIIRKL